MVSTTKARLPRIRPRVSLTPMAAIPPTVRAKPRLRGGRFAGATHEAAAVGSGSLDGVGVAPLISSMVAGSSAVVARGAVGSVIAAPTPLPTADDRDS